MTARPVIGNAAARSLFLARHALGDDPRRKQSAADLLALIERIGFVQVDSINTVARAHDMILFARNQTYRPANLARLLERDRALFENWTHDAAIIPSRFFPYWRPRFARSAERIRQRWSGWHRPGFIEMLDEIRAHVAGNGTAMARELGTGEAKSNGGWWDWHPSKTALEYLWRTGELAICHRRGFQKAYDLTERVIPSRYLGEVPSEAEFIDWACASALDRLGFATSGEIAAFWDSVTPAEAAAWCRDKLGRDLIEVEIESADGTKPRRAFARPDLPEMAPEAPCPPDRVRILSPFDPVLRDRKRTERLFGFSYRIEVFVPAPKRQYGYYVFPILEGNRLIGRIDMKC
ncbi:MAG TPA: crosslink repair DNA glycosylase YcaQ family protein, partial [Thermohalobaculum sp.]|nr:crosslink repair DNA glycosylase YcaQ family protein [Thermohalobaculum sp.]